MIIEEYDPTIKYIPGGDNVVADASIRLPVNHAPEEQTNNQLHARVSQLCNKDFVNSKDIVEQWPLDVELIHTHQ